VAEVAVVVESEVDEDDAKFSVFDVNKELHLSFKYAEVVQDDQGL
jgi:hypothetical protein